MGASYLPFGLRVELLPLYVLRVVALYAVATAAFDCLHFALHRSLRSRSSALRFLGGLHQQHHDFLGADLRFDDAKVIANFVYHRIPEFFTQVVLIVLASLVVDPVTVTATLILVTVLFLETTRRRGRDSNHVAFDVLPVLRSGLFVGPVYHSLHHIHPDSYMSSFTTLFDRIAGTGCQIQGRRFVVSGASGSFGAPFKEMLEREGASVVTPIKFGVDYTYDDYDKLAPIFREADVLVLCHGAKGEQAMQANCGSFVAMIERFRAQHQGERFPVEVWAVGSEIECHPAWGNPELQVYLESKRAFARRARWYFHHGSFIYRHIVPSAFTSPMGPGLISGRTAAAIAMFFIKRGFHYVPVTYSGIALLNYFKFLFRIHATAPSQLSER
jgi:hypothetical protein